jgi:transcriptional regulator with XRE-family HTH domain
MLYAVPSKSTPDQRKDLGVLVRQTRVAMGLSADKAAERAGMSPVTWLRVEAGQSARELTYGGVEKVLRWRPGSIIGYLKGDKEPRGEDPGPAVGSDRRRYAGRSAEDVAAEIRSILDDPHYSEEERLDLAEILVTAWERDEAESRRRRVAQAKTIADTYRRARSA